MLIYEVQRIYEPTWLEQIKESGKHEYVRRDKTVYGRVRETSKGKKRGHRRLSVLMQVWEAWRHDETIEERKELYGIETE